MPRREETHAHQIVLRHVNNLDLPADVRQKIMLMISDPAPPEGCLTIQDALTRGVLARSANPNETDTQRHVRVCFYALVYFPGHVVPDHHYLSFATGTRIREGSQEVEVFRRNASKRCEKAINGLNLPGVAFRRVNALINSTTGAGFRLTISGDDYVTQINVEKERKLAIAANRHLEALRESRIRPDMVQDPLLRTRLVEMKETSNILSATPQVKGLLESVKRPRRGGQGNGNAGEAASG